jgi:hypothetical protein
MGGGGGGSGGAAVGVYERRGKLGLRNAKAVLSSFICPG